MEEKKSLYDISWQVDEKCYRSDPALSYSTLARFKREGFNKLDSLFEQVSSPSLTFGSCVDALITGGQEEFDKNFLVAEFPEIKPSVEAMVKRLFTDWGEIHMALKDIPDDKIIALSEELAFQLNWQPKTRAKVIKEQGAEYYQLLRAAKGKTIINTDLKVEVDNAVRALRESDATKFYFAKDNPFDKRYQRLYQLKFKATLDGVDYRCMPDLLISDSEKKIIYPIDLKTSSHTEWDFWKSFIDWSYDIQSRLYWRIIRDNLDRDEYFKDFTLDDYRFIVVNKQTLTPLVWKFDDTQKMGTLEYGHDGAIISLVDPFDLGKELHHYLTDKPKVPDNININGSNNIVEWLNKESMSVKTVIKRGGTKENFNVDKIKNAVKSAFKAIGEEVPDEVYKRIDETEFKDNLSVEDIQDIVEDYLMDVDHLAAKMFILYRETHKQARLVRSRLDYMQEYAYNNENAASSSETDANSNVSVKNVANLEGEVYKLLNRTVQRQRMKDELNKLYPNSGLGHQYINDLRHHILYQHDESSTPVLKFYCQADSLYPLMTEGVGNIDGVTPTPPNDLESFCGQMRNLVFLLSSQCKGATAYAGYNIALAYYIRTEFGPQWYNKLDVTYTNEHVIKQHTIRHRIAKAIKDFIWSINQPAGNRSFNSPFTNISWFDKYYFQAMYGDFYYPDGTKPKWEEVDVLQRMEMQILRELRLITPLTFPVTTTSLLYDEKTKEFKDPEYYHLACEEYAKGGSFFTYMNSNPASLASCCRVLNEMEDNTFSSTTGMNGEMTGSCNVMTLNLNRIVQDWARQPAKEGVNVPNYTGLKEYLCKILERVYKYQIAYKTMLYDMEDKGMFAASNGNYIYMKKLYSTIGVIGYMEAAEFLGLEIGYNENYTNFLEFILSTIRDENKKHSILDKKRPFKFNTEAIPGENLGVKLYNWDKEDGYKVTEGRERYSCYFFNPWDNNISVLDKLKLHGGNIAKSTDGGEACHLNLDAHLSEPQYEKLLQYAAQVGCNYFTFNIPMSKCDDCGHVVNAPISKCPKCGSTHITYYTRIIGYLTAVKNWSDPMQKEFTQRIYTDKTIGEIVKGEEQNSDK